MLTDQSFFVPDWPAPTRVRAVSTTRLGGNSRGAYAGFNLAAHVGDDAAAVAANRAALADALQLPSPPCWLDQVHGTRVLELPAADGRAGDAAWTAHADEVCAVLTADCLPVLLCAADGGCVAAVHAGWRGLVDGVIEAAITALPAAPSRLRAWLGPAIGPSAFEVGNEVRDRFVAADAAAAAHFVVAPASGKFFADLDGLARQRLRAAGVESIHGGGRCTLSQPQQFFSFRRDGRCGRMASLVWIEDGSA